MKNFLLILFIFIVSCGTPSHYHSISTVGTSHKASVITADGGYGLSREHKTIELAVMAAFRACEGYNSIYSCELDYIDNRQVDLVEKREWKKKYIRNKDKFDFISDSNGWFTATLRVEKNEKPIVENKKKSEEIVTEEYRTGTGFFINDLGYLLTNNHVIDGCKKIIVFSGSQQSDLKLIANDNLNDLALLKANFTPAGSLPISNSDGELLEDIYVGGYPYGNAISSSIKITKGIISSLTGIGNNYSNMQIDAAIQPGNSGGPIINSKGNVVGVAVSKLNFLKILEDFGTIPEGTNFGIKSSTVIQFINANNVLSVKSNNSNLEPTQLSRRIKDSTVYIECVL